MNPRPTLGGKGIHILQGIIIHFAQPIKIKLKSTQHKTLWWTYGKRASNRMPFSYQTFCHLNSKLLLRYSRHGLNNGLFNKWTALDHLNTKLVHHSDPYCIHIFTGSRNPFIVALGFLDKPCNQFSDKHTLVS